MTLLRTRTLPLSVGMVEALQLVVVVLCRVSSLQSTQAKVSSREGLRARYQALITLRGVDARSGS